MNVCPAHPAARGDQCNPGPLTFLLEVHPILSEEGVGSQPLTGQEGKERRKTLNRWSGNMSSTRKASNLTLKSIQKPATDQSMIPHQQKRHVTRPNPEAILIRPVKGKTFAEVLGSICSEVNAKALRQKQSGNVLVLIKLLLGTRAKPISVKTSSTLVE